MPLITYNRDIPNAPNNPSVDQPDMKTNTNSTDDIIDVDHYSFNEANGGLHRQVQMPVLAAIPAGLISSEGTLYTKASTGSQLFYSPDTTANEYQLTRCITADFTKFSTNTNYSGTMDGGWTFLPGGMLFQYGRIPSTSTSSVTIIFPVAFTNVPYSVQVSAVIDDSSTIRLSILDGSVSTTQFQTNSTSSSHLKYVYWTAIGV